MDPMHIGRTSHWIEAEVRYLTTAEGGRQTPVASGYRGQFHYADDPDSPFDGTQYFPDYADGDFMPLGTTVRTHIAFSRERWDAHHVKRMCVGMPFQIQEGAKIVGRGTVTKLSVDGLSP